MKQNSVPSFVIECGRKENEWVEAHDKLKKTINVKFQQSTQIEWWQTNVTIRSYFAKVVKTVKEELVSGQKVSSRILSKSKIASETKLNRGTLYHPDRIIWVESEIKAIRKLIKLSLQSDTEKLIVSLKSKNRELAKKLDLQRSETAKWFTECEFKNEAIRTLEKKVKALSRSLNASANTKIDGSFPTLRVDRDV